MGNCGSTSSRDMDITKLGAWSTCAQVRAAVAKIPGNKLETLKNSTTIITGANTGIGKKTAQHLAYLGGVVVIACRDIKKADKAIEDIKNDPETKKFLKENPDVKELRLFGLPLELGSLKSVESFANQFKAKSVEQNWPPLYCLVLNAGILPFGGYKASEEGYESTFAVNHLGHFLLTRLLLKENPDLKRIVVVSSDSHFGPLAAKGEDLLSSAAFTAKVVEPGKANWTSSISGINAYGSSKLCNVLFASELERRFSAEGLHSASLHPGTAIATDIGRDVGFVDFLAKHVFSLFTKSLDQGSSTTLLCCLLPDEKMHGQYFSHCQETKMSWRAKGEKGEQAALVLWNLSEQLCKSYL